MSEPKQTYLDLRSALDLSKPLPELDFVLPGLLAGTVGMIAAPGGTGKTFWMIQAGISVASQEPRIPFFGGIWEAPKCSGKVMLLLAEDPLDILVHRVRAIGKWLSTGYDLLQLADTLAAKLEVHSLVGWQPCLIDAEGKPNRAWLDMLKRAAEGARLLGIDPLRRWHQGNEMDNGVMMYLIQLLEEIAKNSGCTILFSHHVNKQSMLNASGGEQGAARGASALTDGVRWQANLVKMNSEEATKLGVDEAMRGHYVRMEICKSNYGTPQHDPVWLRREEGGVLTKAVLRNLGKTSRREKNGKAYEKALEESPTE